MKNKNNSYFFYTSASLLLHILIAILIFLQFFVFTKFAIRPTNPSIASYVYIKNENISEKMMLQKSSQVVSKPVISHTSHNLKSIQQDAMLTSTGTTQFELLKLLHNAISQNQRYPDSALFLNQSGITRVSFRLFPDGHIEQLQIVKTSGIQSLDQAALKAVTATFPYKGAAIYLQEPKQFFIDIEFQ